MAKQLREPDEPSISGKRDGDGSVLNDRRCVCTKENTIYACRVCAVETTFKLGRFYKSVEYAELLTLAHLIHNIWLLWACILMHIVRGNINDIERKLI